MSKIVFSSLDDYFWLYMKGATYELWAIVIVLVVIPVILMTVKYFKGKSLHGSFRFVLSLYVVLILFSTVFLREPSAVRRYNLTPLWSYHAPNGDLQASLLMENLLNVCLFVPFGILYGCSCGKKSILNVFVSGGALSVVIEIIQYITKRGFAEFDDVMHNTLGCLIGYLLYLSLAKVYWLCRQ